MQADFDPYPAFDLLTPLSFAIIGQSTDRQVVASPGTGFFIAPYIAITAKHVVDALWKELNLPWNQKYPTVPKKSDFFVKPMQLLDIRKTQRDVVAVWEITSVTPSNYTDAAFLFVVPDNEVARMLQWPRGFPELQLEPPDVGSEIFAFGYPSSKFIDFEPGHTRIDFGGTPTLVRGEVTAMHKNGRGSWRFPQFETTAEFEHGLSGSPIVHDKKVCGIVSYGTKTEDGAGASYGASLWPLLLSEVSPSIDPAARSTPVIDLLKSGQLRASGWKSLKERVTVAETDTGHPIAKLTCE